MPFKQTLLSKLNNALNSFNQPYLRFITSLINGRLYLYLSKMHKLPSNQAFHNSHRIPSTQGETCLVYLARIYVVRRKPLLILISQADLRWESNQRPQGLPDFQWHKTSALITRPDGHHNALNSNINIQSCPIFK